MNLDNLRLRSETVKAIRKYFDARSYQEMHTPRLVGLPGQEPYLEPFWTSVQESNALRPTPCALITSPEYAMKRLLANDMDKIYDLGPCFRNQEPWDKSHDPEFLMLEWYRKNGDIHALMDETEELIRRVQTDLISSFGTENVTTIPSSIPRKTCEEVWKEYTGTDLASLIGDRDAMARLVQEHHQAVSDSDTWDDLFFKIFLSNIEPEISKQGCFLYRYPISMAALAKPCADDPRFADRVELYLNGLEISNGFVELADAEEQRKRFNEERALRSSLQKETWDIDEAFLSDLPRMGSAIGNALGVDRLAMVFAGTSSINDILPFSARERFSGNK